MSAGEGKRVRLLWGDCLEKMAELEEDSVDFVFTDPPYGVTRGLDAPAGSEFTEANNREIPWKEWWTEIGRVCKEGSAVLVMGVQPFTTKVAVSGWSWLAYEWIWEKSRVTGAFNAAKRPMTSHCNILVFAVGGKLAAGRYENQGRPEDPGTCAKTVVRFASVEKPEHYSQKPVELADYMVRSYSRVRELVLDPFMGSGTCGVAAVAAGRRFVGIEVQREFVMVSRDRIRAMVDEVDAAVVQ